MPERTATPVDDDARTGDQPDAVARTEVTKPASDGPLSLAQDGDRSMVTSLPLHLVSEHEVWGAVSLAQDDAQSLHEHLHQAASEQECGHEDDDLRFRPRRALAAIDARYASSDTVEGMLTSVSAPPTTPA